MFTQNRANNFSAKAEFIIKDKTIDIEPLEYNIQDFTIPSTTLNPVELSQLGQQGLIPGDRLVQEQSLTLNFILDENLEVLFSLQQIQEMSLANGKSDDIFIANILNHKNAVIAISSFEKVWIQEIGSIEYKVSGEETTVILPVTISYFNHKIVKA